MRPELVLLAAPLLACASASPRPAAPPAAASAPRVVYRIDLPDLFPEGIAVDEATGQTFLSSLRHGGVLAVDRGGATRWLVEPAPDGPWRTLGLRVQGRRLYFVSNEPAGPEKPRSALFVADLESGRILRRVEAPPGRAHLLNDLAVTSDGTAWVTDSKAGTVYRVPPGATRMEPLVPEGRFEYANGIVATRDGTGLLVADTGAGLYRLIPGGGCTAVALAPGLDPRALVGIDGVARRGDVLVAIENYPGPARVVELRLDPSETTLVDLRVLASPLEGVPTTGTFAGDRFRFIGNSQIPLLQREGVRPDPFLVLEVETGDGG